MGWRKTSLVLCLLLLTCARARYLSPQPPPDTDEHEAAGEWSRGGVVRQADSVLGFLGLRPQSKASGDSGSGDDDWREHGPWARGRRRIVRMMVGF